MKSRAVIRQLFRDYYASHGLEVESPSMAQKREFGFISFDRVMVRHKAFAGESDLQSFLGEFVPSDAYYSSAYYQDPEANMEQKGWLGADLVFDIDADHIPTPCEKIHDEWVCGGCGFAGKGTAPDTCPICGKEKFETNTWPCEVCLETAKKETVKLLGMLKEDMGFSEKEMQVFYSGHRGYHVHLESQIVQALDAIARKEIVDYLTGLGLDLAFHGFDEKTWKEAPLSGASSMGSSGWHKHVLLGVQNFISGAQANDLIEIGLKKHIAETLVRNKDSILRSLSGAGTSGGVKGVGYETWRRIIDHVVKLESAKIDTVVTTDIHRLIRLAGSLHSKTGLKKVEVAASGIDDFDPFKSSVAFKQGTLKVSVSDAPAFRILDNTFGPYRKKEVELPTAAAVLLVCRDRAEVVG